MLYSKRHKGDLEKQKAERTNMENPLKRKAMVDKLETVKLRKQEMEQIVKEIRKSSNTKLLKADEKQDDVAQSKSATFLKVSMQKNFFLEDLTIAQSKIEADLKTMA